MTIEAATYIADLQPTNPPATDPRGQGDDHIRLIKTVLQNTFQGATRAFQLPTTRAVSGTPLNIQKSDGEATLFYTTGASPININLPVLTAGDAGWKCNFIKNSTDLSPAFVYPPSGNLSTGGFSVAF